MTVMEALRMVFGYAKVVPYMETFTSLGYIVPIEESESTTKINKYASFSQAHDPTSYRTRLATQVQNFIAGGDDLVNSSIIEPADG